MTIICWDGKTLAADKQLTQGSSKQTVTKIWRTQLGLLAICGDLMKALEMKSWLLQGLPNELYPEYDRDEHHGTELVVVNDYEIVAYSKSPYPYKIEDKKFAMGSGRDFALAAMHLGYNALASIQVACALDSNCGMGMDFLELSPSKLLDIEQPIPQYKSSPTTPLAKEVIRRLRLCMGVEGVSDTDKKLLRPLIDLYQQNKNPHCLNDKQVETVQTIYNKHFEDE